MESRWGRLHQTVHRKCVFLWLPMQQGIGARDGNHLIPLQFVTTNGLKLCSQMLSSLAKEFFGDSIELEQRTDSQEIFYRRVTLGGRSNRQGKGRGNRWRVIPVWLRVR